MHEYKVFHLFAIHNKCMAYVGLSQPIADQLVCWQYNGGSPFLVYQVSFAPWAPIHHLPMLHFMILYYTLVLLPSNAIGNEVRVIFSFNSIIHLLNDLMKLLVRCSHFDVVLKNDLVQQFFGSPSYHALASFAYIFLNTFILAL